MHASALSNVARRRLVHGATIQSAAASTSATSIPPASTVHDVPNVPLNTSRSRKVVCDSNKNMTLTARSPASSPTTARQLRQAQGRPVPTSLLLSSGGTDKLPLPHLRALHTSPVARRQGVADPNTFEARRHAIPTSAWSRPPRPSQDADDDVVPSYYLERKKQRDAISQRKEEEGGLMNDLSAGILGDGLAASTKVREEKMPVEVRLPDGTVAHPSGFEPPTAETEFHPVAAKVDTEEHPLVATVKQPWGEHEPDTVGAEPIEVDKAKEEEWIKRMVSDGNGGAGVVSGVSDIGAEPLPSTMFERAKALAARADDPDSVVPRFYVERKRQRDAVVERVEEERDLMHELLGDEVAAQMRDREEKIPVEVVLDDGTVAHPSGFVPPTPETDFHPVAAKPGDVPKQPWIEVLGASAEGQNGSS